MQSNYIPWKGYFDMINMVDEFILFDSVQYVKKNWRNRNKIKNVNGTQWLTIPVIVKDRFNQYICDTYVCDGYWRGKHLKTIKMTYQKAAHFSEYEEQLEEIYLSSTEKNLSLINKSFIEGINKMLGIDTRITFASDYGYVHTKGNNESILKLAKDAGASTLLNGPKAMEYMMDEQFAEVGIDLVWMDYSGYPEYHQLYGKFEHAITVLDLIINEGPNATKFMKSFHGS